ncbi:hypothetical protein ACHQM5_005778 [Ranunculus cassubicifolius]
MVNTGSNLRGNLQQKEKDGSNGICGAFSTGGCGSYEASGGSTCTAENSGSGGYGENIRCNSIAVLNT